MKDSGKTPPAAQVQAEIPVALWAQQCGISVQAANKRIRTLGIPRGPGGGIDPVLAQQIVTQRLDARQQRTSARPPRDQSTENPPAVKQIPPGESGLSSSALNSARLNTEIEKGRKLSLENAESEGRLLPREVVYETWGALISPAKTRLLSLGAKLGPLVAIESDAAACQAMIDGAVYEALAEIAEYRPHA